MAVVQAPVCYAAACHSVCKYVAGIGKCIAAHIAAIAEAGDTDLFRVCTAVGNEPFYHCTVVFHLPMAEVVVHIVYPFFTEMAACSVIHHYLYQPFFCIPLLVAAKGECIHTGTCIGAAVD